MFIINTTISLISVAMVLFVYGIIKKPPAAELNIFGLETKPNFEFIDIMVEETRTTCLFICNSGLKNIFA